MELGELLQKAQGHLHVERAFGTPIERDGCTVVPVAMVAGGAGGGGDNRVEDGGGGAGWGGITYPIGAYVVKGGEVRFVPALDATRLLLGALALVKVVMKLRGARKLTAPKRD